MWIVRQGAEQFGEQWSYVLDFWHVSEYLGEVAGGDGKWLREQQERLRANESTSVMKELEELGRERAGRRRGAARSICGSGGSIWIMRARWRKGIRSGAGR